MQEPGLIHLYLGKGKGKTTAAIGLAARAYGNKLRIKIIQLFKQETGELNTLKKLRIKHKQFKQKHPFLKNYTKEQKTKLKKELKTFLEKELSNTEEFNLLIIDELGSALSSNLIEQEFITRFLNQKPKNLEVVMTGRDFPERIKQKADYITEMQLIKHPFQHGIKARKGIEF